jgi:tripartite-type tricarboxylate transporter receptor subunit TctC
MLIKRFVAWMFSIGMMVLGAGMVFGQNYPNKPIRIVASAAGGSGDFAARLIAQGLSGALSQQVVVDNRGGVIPGEIVSKAPPDGYTLLIDAASFWIGPLLQETPYDPVKDFAPVTLTDSAPNVLVVNPSLPVKSVKELIALAKARPGELNYGSSSTGSTPHLAAELFNMMAGVKIVRVPFKGSGPAVISLLGGQVQLMFATAGSVAPHVKSGRLRALAVASLQPSALAPGLPTIAASGVPGYEAVAFEGMFAPAKTPVAIIDRLNQEIVRVLNRAEVKERFFNAGVETVGSTPEEFAAAIKSNVAKWGKLIKDAGIRDE